MTEVDSITKTIFESPKKHKGFFGPVLLILSGVILLLNNLGIVPWDAWAELFRFWPVLVIAVGFSMLLGKSGWGSFLVGVVFVVVVFFLASIVIAKYVPGFNSWMQISFPNWVRIKNLVPLGNVY